MNCKDVLELSSLYLSHELDPARAAEIHRHLESCPACSEELEQLAETDATVRQALMAEPVDTTALDGRIRAGMARPERKWLAIAASVAAAAVIAAIAVQIRYTADRTCTAAAWDHRHEVMGGERRSWLSDASAIGELADRHGIAAAAVSQIAPEGFRLERGKLCRLGGVSFVHLVYSDSGERISVFLRQRDAGAAVGIRNLDAAAEHVAYFETHRVSAIVVSDRSTEAAVSIARVAEGVL